MIMTIGIYSWLSVAQLFCSGKSRHDRGVKVSLNLEDLGSAASSVASVGKFMIISEMCKCYI